MTPCGQMKSHFFICLECDVHIIWTLLSAIVRLEVVSLLNKKALIFLVIFIIYPTLLLIATSDD